MPNPLLALVRREIDRRGDAAAGKLPRDMSEAELLRALGWPWRRIADVPPAWIEQARIDDIPAEWLAAEWARLNGARAAAP